MTQQQQLSGLVRITDLKYKAAQADLSRLKHVESALRQNLEELTRRKDVQASKRRELDDAALIAGADIRWHQWVDQRRATINVELAENLAKQEAAKHRLRAAFGQKNATQRLFERMRATNSRDVMRRQNYES